MESNKVFFCGSCRSTRGQFQYDPASLLERRPGDQVTLRKFIVSTGDEILPHRIHVWYIYLDEWLIFMANVGKYTIHGWHGYPLISLGLQRGFHCKDPYKKPTSIALSKLVKVGI